MHSIGASRYPAPNPPLQKDQVGKTTNLQGKKGKWRSHHTVTHVKNIPVTLSEQRRICRIKTPLQVMMACLTIAAAMKGTSACARRPIADTYNRAVSTTLTPYSAGEVAAFSPQASVMVYPGNFTGEILPAVPVGAGRDRPLANAAEVEASRQESESEALMMKSFVMSFISMLDDIFRLVDITEDTPQKDFMNGVRRITESAGERDARREAIQALLQDKGFAASAMQLKKYHSEFYYYASDTSDEKITISTQGTNLVVNATEYDPSKPTLVISAHFDRVEEGKGAIDNASGCKAAIDLACYFRDHPLPNHNVQAVFFDDEEKGLNGSRHFVQHCLKAKNCPELVINLDMMGNGTLLFAAGQDTMHNFYVNDAPKPVNAKEAAFITELAKQATPHHVPVVNNGAASQSDNLSFQRVGSPAVGISLLNEDAPQAFKNYQEKNRAAWHVPEPQPGPDPAINAENTEKYNEEVDEIYARAQELKDGIGLLKVIHTSRDTPDKINPEQAVQAVEIIAQTITAWSTKAYKYR